MSTPTTKSVIRKAYRLLTDPARWTRGAFARNEYGYATLWENPKATCFCTEGAIRRVSENRTHWDARHKALEFVRLAVGRDWQNDIPTFNDDDATTHKDVLKTLRKAYKLAGGSRP